MKKLLTALIILMLASIPAAYAQEDGTTSLKGSVEAAVSHHPQIKSLLFNRDAISRNLSAALGRFFPSLDLTSQYGLQKYNSSTTRGLGTEDRTRTAADTTLTLTQNVFDGMERYNFYQSSKAQLTSAEHRLYDNVETVALDAVRAHTDVVRERRLVALAGDNIIAHQEVLDSIAERVAGGAASMADEMQARGRVARAETTLITYTGSLHTAEAQYKRVTGMKAEVLGDPEYVLDSLPASMEEVLDTALTSNPKINIFKTEVEVAEKDKNVTRSTLMPDVDIEVSSRHTDKVDGSETYIQDNKAMLSLSWNLFNGGTDYNDLKAANARIQEAQANHQDAIDDITRQVATAWVEYMTAVQSIDKHTEALQYSMESRDMYMMQFNVGQRSLLDVLDSINEVFSNSVLLETAQSNRNFALYKLHALAGELVQSLEVKKEKFIPDDK